MTDQAQHVQPVLDSPYECVVLEGGFSGLDIEAFARNRLHRP